MAPGARRDVNSPPAGAPRVGLIVSARTTFAGETDEMWANGITYEPECVPDSGGVLDLCDPASKDDPAPNDVVEWDAYAVQIGYRCSTFGYRGKDWRALARRRLLADEERQISRELWRGDLAQAGGYPNRWLADVANVDILTEGGPVALTHGLACLEQYLADCNGGQQGMIHATRQVVTHWQGLGLLRREGNLLLTAVDTIVVPGAGYDGSDPDGNDATTGDVWAYATGIVDVRRGEIVVLGDPNSNPEQVNRTTNTIRVFAERPALASWDGCCHGGVMLDVTVCGIGGS